MGTYGADVTKLAIGALVLISALSSTNVARSFGLRDLLPQVPEVVPSPGWVGFFGYYEPRTFATWDYGAHQLDKEGKNFRWLAAILESLQDYGDAAIERDDADMYRDAVRRSDALLGFVAEFSEASDLAKRLKAGGFAGRENKAFPAHTPQFFRFMACSGTGGVESCTPISAKVALFMLPFELEKIESGWHIDCPDGTSGRCFSWSYLGDGTAAVEPLPVGDTNLRELIPFF